MTSHTIDGNTLKTMDTGPDEELIAQVAAGNREVLGQLLDRHAERLTRVVRFRMDDRLRGRLDASDVVQETFVEATKRIDYYLAHRKTEFFLWLRFLGLQKLNELHRFHLGAQARDKRREVSIFNRPVAGATSANIAAQLVGEQTSASEAFARDQARNQMEVALGTMDPMDQEVLALRHFEQLSNAEVADALGLSTSAASKRFLRAIQRLKSIAEKYNPE